MARVANVASGGLAASSHQNALITDYVSQTDTTDQNLASDIEITALKELRTNIISDTSGGAIDCTDATMALKDGSTIGGDTICKIKTGTYTGDGGVSQGVTGIGFQPKYVKIWKHVAATGNAHSIEKTDSMTGSYAFRVEGGVSGGDYTDNQLMSLDADGFTVNDRGTDSHPNTNGQSYDYIAYG